MARHGGPLRPVAPHGRTCSSRGRMRCKLLSDTGINSLEKFPVNTAKQFVPTAPNGNVIGDGILFHLDEDEYVFVGRAPARELAAVPGRDRWLQRRDREGRPLALAARTVSAVTRKYWRFQIQGPNAWPIIEKINGGKVEEVKFFHMDYLDVAGDRVRTLRHGMAGAPGLEMWGPYDSTEGSATPSSKRARSSASSRAAPARTPPTPSSRAGSPRPSARSTPARTSGRTASGSARTATRRTTRSRAASCPTTSRTTTSTRGSSATARS